MDEGVIKAGTVLARGRDRQEREFPYTLDRETQTDYNDVETVTYHLRATQDGGIFLLSIEDEQIWLRIKMASHDSHPAVSGMGLAEALIRRAWEILGKPVVSSSNRPEQKIHPVTGRRTDMNEGVYRTVAADNFWRRMVQSGKAIYVPEEDRFYFPISAYPIER